MRHRNIKDSTGSTIHRLPSRSSIKKSIWPGFINFQQCYFLLIFLHSLKGLVSTLNLVEDRYWGEHLVWKSALYVHCKISYGWLSFVWSLVCIFYLSCWSLVRVKLLLSSIESSWLTLLQSFKNTTLGIVNVLKCFCWTRLNDNYLMWRGRRISSTAEHPLT